MKAYKVEVLVIDFEGIGEESVHEEIENANYSNDCIIPKVMNSWVADIGNWSDDHPLNKRQTAPTEYARLFAMDSGANK